MHALTKKVQHTVLINSLKQTGFLINTGCRMRTVHDRAAAQNVCQNLFKCTRDETREALPASHVDQMCMHTKRHAMQHSCVTIWHRERLVCCV